MTALTADDALEPIQAALYARLSGDATLTGLLGHRAGQNGVYDDVPENALYPHVVIGEAIETPDGAHDRFGAQVVVTIHVWVEARGFKTAYPIVRRLRALLDEQPLPITGHHTVSVRWEFTQTLGDPNPELRHLPVRFRITTEQE